MHQSNYFSFFLGLRVLTKVLNHTYNYVSYSKQLTIPCLLTKPKQKPISYYEVFNAEKLVPTLAMSSAVSIPIFILLLLCVNFMLYKPHCLFLGRLFWSTYGWCTHARCQTSLIRGWSESLPFADRDGYPIAVEAQDVSIIQYPFSMLMVSLHCHWSWIPYLCPCTAQILSRQRTLSS